MGQRFGNFLKLSGGRGLVVGAPASDPSVGFYLLPSVFLHKGLLEPEGVAGWSSRGNLEAESSVLWIRLSQGNRALNLLTHSYLVNSVGALGPSWSLPNLASWHCPRLKSGDPHCWAVP